MGRVFAIVLLILSGAALAAEPLAAAPVLAAPAAVSASTPSSPAAPPASVCSLNLHASLDMAMDPTGRITVPVKINGTDKQMMVDTGAPTTLVTMQTVSDLKLKIGFAGNGRYLVGFGGRLSVFVAHIDEFWLGRMRAQNFNIYIEPTFMQSAGLLGADFMRRYELEFDFARAKLNMFDGDHCPGKIVYWTKGSYGIIPFEIEDNHIIMTVTLDGKPVKASLDSGAADTVMSLETASENYALDEKKLQKSRHYPFKTLQFGEVSVNNPAIDLVPDKESGIMGSSRNPQIIIGMGVLRCLHLFISYKEKVIYVTPATQY